MQLYVKNLTGKTFTFDVEPDDTFRSFREKIAADLGLSPQMTKVIVDMNLVELSEDDRTIESFGLTMVSGIRVVKAQKKVQLFVKTLDGKTHTFNFDLYQPFGEFRKLIAKRVGWKLKDTIVIVDMNSVDTTNDNKLMTEFGITAASGIQAVQKSTTQRSKKGWFTFASW